MTDYFAGGIAERYDADDGAEFDKRTIDRTTETLAELASDGRALEFAIGTGRIAIPLQQRGIEVHGIDLSSDMLAQLRAKDESIHAVQGDMTETTTDSTFGLVYLVFNTIGNITTQDGQVACFRNAARHLEAGGRFVIEVGVPDLQRLTPGERFVPFDVSQTHIGIDEYDVVNQGLVSHHYHPGETIRSIPFRYVWPGELDLIARLAGMTLEHRWGDWDRSAFTATSSKHVSVWRKVADQPF